ncbi:MAG: type II toxin-antitoxin system HipA family toxin [Burkholderiales bacterium]|nr:type II toxin-antitoxin system HipA family toxin [Burkholderiales bacterium]
MILLAVWVTLPDATTLKAGELACTQSDEAGRFDSEFAYAEEWLNRREAFALDPVSLPLTRARFRAMNLEPPLGVFDDALPDDWGRKLIIRARNLPRRAQSAPHLLRELADHGLGMGALIFARPDRGRLIRDVRAAVDLDALYQAAERFESGAADAPDELQKLFAAGSSPGGARPKVLVSDATGEWIAKFPSRQRDGRFDVVGLEAVGLDLAAASGIDVPEHRLDCLGERGRRALLVRRFDVVAGGGRRHMISLRTLCKERAGAYAQSYSELAQAVRSVSSAPQEDVDRLFKQMVFNAAFGNTDDHLKNFWMLHDAAGYRLSEAFDLLPDVGERGEHCLAFEYERLSPTRSQLIAVARRWGVAGATTMIDTVLEATATFAAVANAHAVPGSNIVELGSDLDRRARQLAG